MRQSLALQVLMFKEFIRPLILLLSICCQVYTVNAFQINTTDSSSFTRQAVQKAILNASKHDQKQANFSAEIFIQNTGKWNRIPSIWKGPLNRGNHRVQEANSLRGT